MQRRIDAHHHFWAVARGDYHWMPDSGILRHDYLPDELAPHLKSADIEGTILVQAAQTLEETEFLLHLSSQPGSTVLGVTGWVQLDSPQALAQLDKIAPHPKLVAIRPMLQDIQADDWVMQPQVIEHMRRLPQYHLRFEVLTYPQQLPYALRAIERIPELDIVINHLSKPRYGATLQKEWRDCMKQFAQNPHAYCKLSGMVTEVGKGWSVADFQAHAEYVLEHFGPYRVMFGSDWPVCLQCATYEEVVTLAEHLTSQLKEEERNAFWGANAARFYGV